MAGLVWDEAGTRFYETGVSNCALYLQKADGSYDKGVAWNGITAVTESPSGAEATDLYADNIKYATLRSAETFGGTIEAYTYPDEFAECDGTAEPIPGVRLGQQARKAFGLAYKTKVGSDVDTEANGYKLHLIYGATASPSEKAYSTVNDSPDAITFSWEIQTTPTPVNDTYKPLSTIVLDSSKLSKAQLTAIETKLFGEDATLPSPAEIITLISGASGAAA